MSAEQTFSLLRFRAGGFSWGVDPHIVESIASYPAQDGVETYRVFDLAARLGIASGNEKYRRALILKPPPFENERTPVGILAEEIEIEDLPRKAFQKLPQIVEKSIRFDCIMGLALADESLCLLLDGEKIARAV